jgi:hypothetical protein
MRHVLSKTKRPSPLNPVADDGSVSSTGSEFDSNSSSPTYASPPQGSGGKFLVRSRRTSFIDANAIPDMARLAVGATSTKVRQNQLDNPAGTTVQGAHRERNESTAARKRKHIHRLSLDLDNLHYKSLDNQDDTSSIIDTPITTQPTIEALQPTFDMPLPSILQHNIATIKKDLEHKKKLLRNIINALTGYVEQGLQYVEDGEEVDESLDTTYSDGDSSEDGIQFEPDDMIFSNYETSGNTKNTFSILILLKDLLIYNYLVFSWRKLVQAHQH